MRSHFSKMFYPTFLGNVQPHFYPNNETKWDISRTSTFIAIPEPMERNRKKSRAKADVTELCSMARRIFHSHYAKMDSVRIHMDEIKYIKLPEE